MADELKNLINDVRLTEYHNDVIKKNFVKKEEGKGLFSGKYTDLTEVPDDLVTTDDIEDFLTDADLTDYAKTQDVETKIGTAKTDVTNAVDEKLKSYAQKAELPGNATASTPGLAKGDGTTIETNDGVLNVKDGVFTKPADIANFVTESQVNTKLENYVQNSAIEDMATNTSVDNKLKEYAKSADVTSEIKEAIDEIKDDVTSAVTPCGSIAFDDLPTPAESILGDMYDINDQFTTDSNFLHSGQDFPAGTNVICVKNGSAYKWDTYSGYINLGNYILRSDITIASSAFIQGLAS